MIRIKIFISSVIFFAISIDTFSQKPNRTAIADEGIYKGNIPLIEELSEIRIPDFVVEDVSVDLALKKLFSILPRNLKYVKGYKVHEGAALEKAYVQFRDAELGIILVSIASSAGLVLQDDGGIVTFKPRGLGQGIIDRQEISGTNISREVARKLGFPSEEAKSSDVKAQLKAVGLNCSSAQYSSKGGILLTQVGSDLALLRAVITLIERGFVIQNISNK